MNFEVTIDKEGFKGKAMLDFPTRGERMALLTELQKMGYGEGADKGEMTAAKLKLSEKMGDVVDARLVSIEVEHVESGIVITDKGMLDIYSEGQILVGILSQLLLGGVSMGKETNSNSDEQSKVPSEDGKKTSVKARSTK